MALDWATEAQQVLHAIVADILGHPDGPASADFAQIVEDRILVPATIEPSVVPAVLVEALGLAIATVMAASAWTDTPPLVVLDVIENWRLPKTEDAT
jgi:hypothetical protein